jgi:cell division protein FtsB
LAAAFTLALALGYLPYRVRPSVLDRYLHLRSELLRAERDIARLRADNAALRRQAHALKTDLRAIENAARQDLGFVRPGDLIVRFDSVEPEAR